MCKQDAVGCHSNHKCTVLLRSLARFVMGINTFLKNHKLQHVVSCAPAPVHHERAAAVHPSLHSC